MIEIVPKFVTAVEPLAMPATARREVEFVERKGLGHPDSICDSVMEAISVALSQAYVKAVGHVLHHNVDKGLLVAGQTTPKLGGGTVEIPMRLVIGDRASSVFGNKTIPVGEIAEATARDWFRKHLKHVDPDKHLVVQMNCIRARPSYRASSTRTAHRRPWDWLPTTRRSASALRH